MLKPTDHCHSCTNSKFDPKTGIICGLSQERPKFEGKCKDFNLDDEALLKFKTLNKQLSASEMKKSNIIGSTVFQASIGIAILLGTYFLTIFLWDKGWMSSLTILLGAFGLFVLASSVPLYLRNMQKRNLLEEKKDIILEVMNRYK